MARRLSYYPGCSLQGTAKEYDDSIRTVCGLLGFELEELDDWNCCGASSAHITNDELAIGLGVRNLMIAQRAGLDVLVPCAACFSRLKFAEKELLRDGSKWTDEPYRGEISILHLNDILVPPEILKTIAAKVTLPLSGLAVVPYYGCLTVRPPKVTDSEDWENPTSMDRILETLGADVKSWSYKVDCCGGSFTMTRPDIVRRLSGKLLDMAVEAGAEALVTDCPMCQSNLDTRQGEIAAETGKDHNLPIFYITELIALALGESNTARWWKKHFVDPGGLLSSKGVLQP